jgi:hypothetical protein
VFSTQVAKIYEASAKFGVLYKDTILSVGLWNKSLAESGIIGAHFFLS